MSYSNSLDPLPARFAAPPHWQWRELAREGYQLRYGFALPDGAGAPDRVMVILPGLSEFCEKYFEIAHDCLAKGYGVFVIDWRGQGASSRYFAHADKRHSQGFMGDVADLLAALEDSPFSAQDQALFMMAHSMGGAIGLRCLEAHPRLFKGASFGAPLVGLHVFAHVPGVIANGLAAGLDRFWPSAYAPGGGEWDGLSRDYQSDLLFSSDPVRAQIHNYWMRQNPALRVGHITHQWLHDAQQSCLHIQRSSFFEALDLPCLFFLAGHEQFVDNEKAEALCGRMVNAQLTLFPGARHELWMERDYIRSAFLSAIFDCFDAL